MNGEGTSATAREVASRAFAAAATVARGWGRRVAHQWRSSLGFRVVVLTMLLGVLVLSAVGTYLYGSIAQGLVDGRQRIAADDSLRDANAAQGKFDVNDKNATQADLTQSASDIVNAYRRDTGNEIRYVVLSRLETNTYPLVIGPIESGSIGLRYVPDDLRTAVAQEPDRQHLQVTSIGEGSGEISAVVVGQKITLPVAGDYGLYFIYPMYREREIINSIRPDLRVRRHRSHPARGRDLVRGHPSGGRPGAAGRPGGRAVRRRQPQRAHAGQGRGRPGSARQLLQRDGGLHPAADRPAREPLEGPAALRLRRLTRAAHAAHDHSDGRRPHPRLEARLRTHGGAVVRAALPRARPLRSRC